MKVTSKDLRIFSCVLALFALASQSFAQPPGYTPGYHWADRAVAYAQTFCNGTNPEYGRSFWTDSLGVDHIADCADFTSQIANAGCSGMCEANDTNWPGWTAPDSTCWDYRSSEPHSNMAHGCDPGHILCMPCSTGWHQVISNANSQAWWFYCSDSNYVNQRVSITDTDQIPDWIGKGCFAFRVLWDQDQQSCKWHAVFIGSGTGSGARYYGHTSDRCGVSITGLFSEPGFRHVEFYKARIFSPTGEGTK
jgi:hypothetical protein